MSEQAILEVLVVKESDRPEGAILVSGGEVRLFHPNYETTEDLRAYLMGLGFKHYSRDG